MISEILNVQYKSGFTNPLAHFQVGTPKEVFGSTHLQNKMRIIDNISEETHVISAIDVQTQSHALTDPHKSPSRNSTERLPILCQIFLAIGRPHKILKEGIICPINKGGSRASTKSYRTLPLNFCVTRII